jgi:hypothetical protein
MAGLGSWRSRIIVVVDDADLKCCVLIGESCTCGCARHGGVYFSTPDRRQPSEYFSLPSLLTLLTFQICRK